MNNKGLNIDPIFIANFQFQIGHFEEAEESFQKILELEPDNFQVLVMLGNLALMKNNFEVVEQLLTKAHELFPLEPAPHALLAEMYIRQDSFTEAAFHLRSYGFLDLAIRLDSFVDVTPFKIISRNSEYSIDVVAIDPLPVIKVQINNQKPVNLLIDTGAAEIILDSEYANELDLPIFGDRVGTFAGGSQATTSLSKIESITIGDLEVHNIPVTLLPIREIGKVLGDIKIDGIIGTTFFYHFITTIDYPNGKIIIRKKQEEQLKKLKTTLENPIIIPFWLAEDHYMVAWGQINDGEPMLMFVDTGLAGGGFTSSKAILESNNVLLDENKSFEGIGGAGKVKAIPFEIAKLKFGEAVEYNIRGIYSGNFPLENKLGFRVGGIISHQFFRNYALTFDFMNMNFLLQKEK